LTQHTNSGHNLGMDYQVVSLFDRTGTMVRPWAIAGYQCLCLDIQHTELTSPECFPSGGCIDKHGCDVRNYSKVYNLNPAIIFAFPPCTNLAVSGARWFQAKGLQGVIDALELVEAAREICDGSEAPYMIENPVSTLSTYWRKPDYRFDPCDYAGYLPDSTEDAYTKKTCLWTGNGFVMPAPRKVKPVLGSKMHRLPPSADRANLRSATPKGFAEAVFEANKHIGQELPCLT
jgi:hypothetical protein